MRLDLTPLDDAQMVFESLPDFLREARFLRDQLQQRNESLDDPD